MTLPELLAWIENRTDYFGTVEIRAQVIRELIQECLTYAEIENQPILEVSEP